MKKHLYIMILMLILSILTSRFCIAQDLSIANFKWIQGEWINADHGDILDVKSDSLRFLKNGLVFDESEDWAVDVERPETMDDLKPLMIWRDKVPYELEFGYDTIVNERFLALLFDYNTSEYPFQMEKVYIGIDAANKLLYYYDKTGNKVFLDKVSDYTFEEQLDKKLKESREQIIQGLANGEYDWLFGVWEFEGGFLESYDDYAVSIDKDSVMEGSVLWNESTNKKEYVFDEKKPLCLNYEKGEGDVYLTINLSLVGIDEKAHQLYIADEFSRWNFTKVSDYPYEKMLVIAEQEEKAARAAERRDNIIHYSIMAVIGLFALALLFLLVWGIRKLVLRIKVSVKKASEKAKERAKLKAEKAKESRTTASVKGLWHQRVIAAWQNKKVKIAVIAALILIPVLIIAFTGGEESNGTKSSGNHHNASKSNYTERYPDGDYSNNYWNYIDIDLRQERAYGLDVYVRNKTNQTIREVEISFYADGHTEKMRCYNLSPNERQNKLLSYFGDYDPAISKVVIKWK